MRVQHTGEATRTAGPPEGALPRVPSDATTALTVLFFLTFVIPAPEAVGFLGGAGTPAMIACVCLAATWCVASLRHVSAVGSRCVPLRAAVLVLAASSIASWAVASSRRITGAEVRAADRGLLVLMAMMGLALFTAELMRSRDRLDVAIDRLVLGGCFLAFVGIAQFNVHFEVVRVLHIPGLSIVNPEAAHGTLGFISVGSRSGLARVAGTTLHPVEFGYTLAVVFPLALHRMFFAPAGRTKFWAIAPVVTIGIGVLMSLSRTASLGVLITGLVLVPTWPRRRRFKSFIAVPLFLVMTRLLYPGLVGTGLALFRSIHQDSSVTARTARYAQASQLIHHAPILGRGIKTLIPPMVFDNQYLETTIETGFFGLLALISVLLTGITLVRLVRHASRDPRTRDLAQCLTACIAIPLVTFSTWDALSFPVATIVTFVVIGFAGALWRLEGRPGPAGIEARRSSETDGNSDAIRPVGPRLIVATNDT